MLPLNQVTTTTTTRQSLIRSVRQVATFNKVAPLAVVVCSLVFFISSSQALDLNSSKGSAATVADQQQQQQNDKDSKKVSLEAELESIVQERDSFDPSDRSLAEAIISRLMLDNLQSELSPATLFESSSENTNGGAIGESLGGESLGPDNSIEQQLQQQRAYSGPEAMRLKKLLSMFEAYESMVNSGDSRYGSALPMLPASPAATSKRAAKLAGNYLQQHHQTRSSNPTGYGRSSFDFGLGKRPDTTGAASNILRYGDSLSGGGGSVQGVNQFGKRPSAHRYDFGLGKRKASSAYPRYDFGLGKRAPNVIRYDFGLGK